MAPIGPRPAARERAANAYRLRCSHRTWDDIARTLGYGSPAAAYNAVQKHIKRMPAEDQTAARALSAGTYRLVISELYDVATMAKGLGQPKAAGDALGKMAEVQEKHDRLIGIEAATKIDVNVTSTAIAVLERAEAELLAIAQPQANVIDAEVIEG